MDYRFRGNDDREALTFLDGKPAGCSKRLRGEAREKSTSGGVLNPVRCSEAIERNEAYEAFSAAC